MLSSAAAYAFEDADADNGLALIETTLQMVVLVPASGYLGSEDEANAVSASAVLSHILDGEPRSDSADSTPPLLSRADLRQPCDHGGGVSQPQAVPPGGRFKIP